MKLSLVLPAYNEAALIGATVTTVDAQLRTLGSDYEIIVGDDGSTDGTAAAARAVGLPRVRVLTRPHSGKGGILTAGLREVRGEYVGFLDSDLEIDVAYLPMLVQALDEGYDAAIGSKTIDPVQARSRPLSRRVATGMYNLLVRLLFHSSLADHQAGFKLFRRERLSAILPGIRNTGWLWDTEVLVSLIHAGCRIKEIPVATRSRQDTKVRMVRTSWQMFQDLLALYRAKRKDWT